MAGILDLLRGGSISPDDPILNVQQPGYGEMTPNAPPMQQKHGGGIGKILGILGDAISVGAGGEANYTNRMKEQMFSQGLQMLQNGDQAGIQLMGQADPKLASQVMHNLQTNQIAAAKAGPEILNNKDKYEENTFSRLAGFARASNPQTWPAMKAQMEKIAAERGYKGSLDLPDEWTPEWAESFSQQGIDPDKAATLKSNEAYRDATLNLNTRKANADVALRTGALKVRAAEVAGTQGQRAASTGVAAAGVGVRQQNANTAERKAGTGGATSAAKVDLPPKFTPAFEGQIQTNKRTHTNWRAENGKWVKQ